MIVPKQLLDAAENKFGVIVAVRPHRSGGHVFLIRPDEPANESLPFMTIRGIIPPSDRADFAWGHYDLDETQAHKDFEER